MAGLIKQLISLMKIYKTNADASFDGCIGIYITVIFSNEGTEFKIRQSFDIIILIKVN